ncbi:MAG: autotransporter outer membrane beta-barrel domain-containing protein [Zoogloeaceae bacterium]|jgi:outer membrane autotransporter protein|nr:autotransporter outer membrane beta-barrel domain-containing protein [Zoogloeaceae bacterium]
MNLRPIYTVLALTTFGTGLSLPSAQAACTDGATASATAGSNCTANSAAYTAATNVVTATDAGSILTLTQPSVTVTSGSNVAGSQVVANTGTTIHALGNLTVNSSTGTNSRSVLVDGGGTLTVEGDLVITRDGNNPSGANLENRGAVTVNGSTTLTNNNADGIRSISNTVAVTTLNGPVTINVGAIGIWMGASNQVHILDMLDVTSNVSTTGTSIAVAITDNASVVVDGVSNISTTSNSSATTAHAVQLAGNGLLDLAGGGTISTVGATARGINASDASQFISRDALTINTQGTGAAYGIYLQNTASATLDETSITTTGANAYGIYLNNTATTGTTLTLNDVLTIETSGTGAHGFASIYNPASAVVMQSGSSILTHGDGAHGLAISIPTGDMNPWTVGTGVTIDTEGDNARAVLLNAPAGNVNFSNAGDLTTTGTGGNGIHINDALGGTVTNSGTIATPQAAALYSQATGLIAASNTATGVMTGTVLQAAGQLDLNNAGQWNNTGDSVLTNLTNSSTGVIDYAAPAGGVVKTISAVTYTGLGGSTLDLNGGTLNLSNGGTSAGTMSGAGLMNLTGGTMQALAANTFSTDASVTVAAPATLDLNGFNQTIAGLTNAGLVSMGINTTPGTLLTVNGNVVGQGGTIHFNTVLNDASVQLTDKLIIGNGGTASGNSLISVTDAANGTAGAITTGNGILLVETTGGATTAATAFTLAAPVVAGPYDYTLVRGSADASGPENWYLRSHLDCALDPTAPVCNGGDFRPETSLDAALPSLALIYGRALMDTLHERIGEEEDLRGSTGLHDKTPYTGGWLRIIGQRGKQDGDRLGIYGSGPKFSYDFATLQGGHDLIRAENANGVRHHLGLTFAFGTADGDVTHYNGAKGDLDLKAYTLGAYWTGFSAAGAYLDVMLQGTRYELGSNAHRGLKSFETDGYGFAGSLEAGYPIKLDNGWFIEPQAQLIYQKINLDDDWDNGARVHFKDVDSLTGRLGARIGRTWKLAGADSRFMTAWIRPNLWREFRGDPVTTFSSATGPVPFHSTLRGSWGEINLGISGQMSKTTTLFANVSYQSRFDGDGSGYGGKIGVRVNW